MGNSFGQITSEKRTKGLVSHKSKPVDFRIRNLPHVLRMMEDELMM